ncbi:MAG: phospholipase D-like domain-containing protein [Coxiellaceae bacterium]|nr:phospholipase D-like domain-containing protein [Coxiellaceae bacterium]
MLVQSKETIFTNGSDYFHQLISDLHQAKHSIDLETYIFSNDTIGRRIMEALIRAAERGVNVRVLVDGCGTPQWGATMAPYLEQAGGKSKVFHPFPWQVWNWSRSVVKLPSMAKGIYLFLKVNSRNHRKVCIIDDKIAYTGSVNIDKSHLSYNEGGDDWRDTGIRIINANLHDLLAAFNSAWTHQTIKERIRNIFSHVKANPTVRLNYSRHRRRILYKNLLRRIDHCKQRIWITNAYFVPDNFLLKRLKDAAQRGIDVRILLPRKSDHFIMPWASSTFYASLLKSGIRIFEYLPSILHAKTLMIDDWMLIGSSNLNHRSLLHDLEADVHVEQEESKQILADQFLNDLNHTAEISLKNWWHKRPWYQRFFGRIFLYMKYWV